MKKILLLFMMLCSYSAMYTQSLNVKVKEVKLRPTDSRASIQPREDKNGNKCAIIRVGVVGVDDLEFPDAVGDVEYRLSEYVVYVPKGQNTFQYKNKSGEIFGTIVFDDYGLEIAYPSSYDVIFESDNHLRSAIFAVQPSNARLLFAGEVVKVDADGMAMINKPVGDYTYTISADGFESQSGTVSLIEDEISTVTNVTLQEVMYPVKLNVTPKDAMVFIDDIPYTTEDRKDLKLSGGKHSIRVTAANYADREKEINVGKKTQPIYLILKESETKIVKHKEERTKTSVNIRNAAYITGGVAITEVSTTSQLRQGDCAVDLAFEFSHVQHFARVLALREGVSFGATDYLDKYGDFETDDESEAVYRLDVPLQLGVSFPFGAYNQHLISAYGGGYGKVLFTEGENEKPKYTWDYGIRLSAKLDFSKFSVGVDLGQSLNGMGFAAGVSLGFKFYTSKAK